MLSMESEQSKSIKGGRTATRTKDPVNKSIQRKDVRIHRRGVKQVATNNHPIDHHDMKGVYIELNVMNCMGYQTVGNDPNSE